ncbi:hypothetical protein GCM10023219_11110 [Stakelama sediminis]|uniref:DUF3035 domain-containing protein n=1 Tax=Stakelama sediminis TaxID=463200 RepID=A0A840YW87_9SPHN|nr:DUF3035 domain-containing protein [Stakelama sediminis]MBB5717835.1 hypothetical protein [Stakelama sediminis]
MRKLVPLAAALTAVALLSGCAKNGLNRKSPDEFAVARQPPLVIPPDFSMKPPQPGAVRPQDVSAAQQALEAMFGGPAPRSAVGQQAINAAAAQGNTADPGIRSEVGDADTKVVDKGTTTRDIVAAPQGDGRDASVTTPQQ